MPANILSISSTQSVVIGAEVKLNCFSKGVPAADVVWTRKGKVLVKGSRNAVLQLTKVTQQDDGMYTCTANNSLNRDIAKTEIDVDGGYYAFLLMASY